MSRTGGAPALDGCKRLLVLMPSWVGDITMATPLLRALRRHLPGARIASLLRPGLSELLDGAPWIDECFTAPMRGAGGPWTGLAAARAFGADAVLLLPNSVRSGLAALRLASRRIGYRTPGRRWLLTHPCPTPSARPIPAVDWYCDLGERALGQRIPDRRPELMVTPREHAAATSLLGAPETNEPWTEATGALEPADGSSRKARRWLVVNPGANRADKRWPAERFVAAALRIAREHGLSVAVTGGPSERPLTAQVVSAIAEGPRAPRVLDLAASGVTLGSLKGVLARAALLLTNDTGPRHLAAALGTPSVVLFGPTDHRWTTLARDTHAPQDRLLLAEPFLPEDRVADDHGSVCRIDRISIDDVVHAARSILAFEKPAPSERRDPVDER